MANPWDRIEERNELWFHFQQGRNIAMFAPRRLGKTWLMQNLLYKEGSAKGWCVIYCDLQNANTYQKAIEGLVLALQESAGLAGNLLSLVKAKLAGVLTGEVQTFKDILSQTDPERLFEAVLTSLQERSDKPVLILLDEVTICAANIMKVSAVECALLLNTLRKLRDAYPAIRWMLTGSIGIDHFSKEHNVSGAFNNLHPFLLAPFEAAIADAFVADFCQRKVAKPFFLTAESHLFLQAKLGWLSPYYLEKLCLQIIPTEEKKGQWYASEADIENACQCLLQYPNQQIFSGWPDHLARNIPAQIHPVCKAILGYLSASQAGESIDTLRIYFDPKYTKEQLREALIILCNDGFIKKQQENAKYKFVMQLLADYWQEYYA